MSQDQWDNPKNQTVSCDPSGTKYVLGPAVFEGTDITAVSAALEHQHRRSGSSTSR